MINKNQHELDYCSYVCSNDKPLELYLFIDPFCPDSFALEPVIRKLQIEYGHYFSLIYVLSGKISNLNHHSRKFKKKRLGKRLTSTPIRRESINCNDIEADVNLSSPYIASIAVKAAELQGKRAGVRFLRKLQEYLYLKNRNITDIEVLKQCAKEAYLDIDEFMNDLHSKSTSRAFQCDLKITNEMDVSETPTIVFFNNNVEDAGLKISGVNSYDVYIEIMKEILGTAPVSLPLPPIHAFIKFNQFVSTKDISLLYGIPHLQVELEMKKLLLQQMVERIQTVHGTFWRYTGKIC